MLDFPFPRPSQSGVILPQTAALLTINAWQVLWLFHECELLNSVFILTGPSIGGDHILSTLPYLAVRCGGDWASGWTSGSRSVGGFCRALELSGAQRVGHSLPPVPSPPDFSNTFPAAAGQ